MCVATTPTSSLSGIRREFARAQCKATCPPRPRRAGTSSQCRTKHSRGIRCPLVGGSRARAAASSSVAPPRPPPLGQAGCFSVSSSPHPSTTTTITGRTISVRRHRWANVARTPPHISHSPIQASKQRRCSPQPFAPSPAHPNTPTHPSTQDFVDVEEDLDGGDAVSPPLSPSPNATTRARQKVQHAPNLPRSTVVGHKRAGNKGLVCALSGYPFCPSLPHHRPAYLRLY